MNRRTFGWMLVVGLLAFGMLHLVVRGPVDHKGNFDLCDFASHWATAHLWLTGGNPYDNAILYDTWIGGRGAFETYHEFWLSLLPPGAFVVLTPVAALPPGAAAMLWGLLSIASVVAIIWSVARLANLRRGTLLLWLFIAGTVASAPIQTLIAAGQVSLPAIALIFLAFVAARQRWDLLAGLMLGAAAALKPQLSAPFFLWYLFFARWRVFGTAVTAVLLLNLAGIVPMELRGISWWTDWSRNIALSTAPGAPNDPTSTGPWRNQMIDLRVWLFTLVDNRELVTIKGLIVSMLFAAAYVAILCQRRDAARARRGSLLAIATLSALTLLPVYHKMYDAALLLPAFAWALLALRTPLRGFGIATLLTLSVFLVPFGLIQLISERTNALDAVSQTWWWRVIIFPHHALATLLTCLCLLAAFWQSTRARRRAELPELEAEETFADLATSRT